MAVSGSARGGILRRPRLVELLDSPSARLTVLSASSGFGKTTLLREWVDLLDPATQVAIWVPFGAEVTTADGFWEIVLRAARRLGVLPTVAGETLAAATLAGNDPIELIGGYLMRPGSESLREVVVVLDAYENVRVGGTEVDDALVDLVRRVPRLRVVVASRATTSLTAPSRLLRGEVEVLGQDALAFTTQEIGAFLDVSGERELAVERVERETHGYPLALRAVLLGIGDAKTGDDQHWRSLVAADLLAQLDSRLRMFVLATAVPPYFDAELAATLAALPASGHDAHTALAELEVAGLGRWIPFAPGRPVFQYVEAAREAFLAEMASTSPELRARAAAVSAGWMFGNGIYDQALDLAISGRNYELASEIYRAMILARPDTYTNDGLNKYLSRVPVQALTRYPVLAFARAISCLSNPATHSASVEYFQIAASRLTENLGGLGWTQVVIHHTMKNAALRVLRRFPEAGSAAERALAVYERIEEDDERRLVELRPMVLRHLAYSLFQVGQIERAVAVVDRGITVATTPWSRNYTVVYNLGFHAFDGRLDAAREARSLIDPHAWPPGDVDTYMNALGRVGEAILKLDAFDFAGAQAEYDGGASYLSTAEFWPFITWTLMHARLGLGQALTEAHRVSEAMRGMPPGVGANLGTDALRGALAVLWLSAGRRDAARRVLRAKAPYPGQVAPALALDRLVAGEGEALVPLLPRLEAQRGHTVRSRLATLTIVAAAALRQGNDAVAESLLRRAAALDGGAGARLHLAYLPAGDLLALRSVAARTGDDLVTAYLAGEVRSLVGTMAPVPVLSDREHAVLVALVDHATRGEVAASLHVSPNTVKTHLQSIYRKLGVNSREAVLERAVELDLLADQRLG